MAANGAANTHAKAPDPAGSAVADADLSSAARGTGRSHDDELAALAAAGRSQVVCGRAT